MGTQVEIPSPDREQYELVEVDRKTGAEIRYLRTGAGMSGKGVAPTIDSLKALPAYPPYISADDPPKLRCFLGRQPVQQRPNTLLADRAYLVDGNFRFFPRTLNL